MKNFDRNISTESFSSKGLRMIRFFDKYENASTDEEKQKILEDCSRKENGRAVAKMIEEIRDRDYFLLCMSTYYAAPDTFSNVLNKAVEFVIENGDRIDSSEETVLTKEEKKLLYVCSREHNNATNKVTRLKLQNSAEANVFCHVFDGKYLGMYDYVPKHVLSINVVFHQKIHVTDKEAGLVFGLMKWERENPSKARDIAVREGFYHCYILPRIADFVRPDRLDNDREHGYMPYVEREYTVRLGHEKINDDGASFDVFYQIPIEKLNENNVNEILGRIETLATNPFIGGK